MVLGSVVLGSVVLSFFNLLVKDRSVSSYDYEYEEELSSSGWPPWLLPVIIGVGLLVIIGLAVWLTQPPAPAVPVAPVAPAAPAAQNPPLPQAESALPPHGAVDPDGPPVTLVNVSEAQSLLATGNAVAVDVRSGEQFAAGHIAGAVSFTSPELEARLSLLPADGVIIVYGEVDRLEGSMRSAQIFMGLDYQQAVVLDGGFAAWQAAGLPIE